jgi:hypothetical protein
MGLKWGAVGDLRSDDVSPIHSVWVPLPIIAHSLPHFVRQCDAVAAEVIDLTQDDEAMDVQDDCEVIDLVSE